MNEDTRIEVEALQSIFGEELMVEEGEEWVVSMKIRPHEEKGTSPATIRLHITIPTTYPEMSPRVSLREPRCLDDGAPALLMKEITEKMKEAQGFPVLFDIIQLCSEFLVREGGRSLCPICLSPLSDSPSVVTRCDHYVHVLCMDNYTQHTKRTLGETLQRTPNHLKKDVERVLVCPVCRFQLEEEIEPLYKDPPKKERPNKHANHKQSNNDFVFDWKSWRQELARLKVIFDRQLANDGIIDIEKERKKNLIDEDTVVVIPGQEWMGEGEGTSWGGYQEELMRAANEEIVNSMREGRIQETVARRNRQMEDRTGHNGEGSHEETKTEQKEEAVEANSVKEGGQVRERRYEHRRRGTGEETRNGHEDGRRKERGNEEGKRGGRGRGRGMRGGYTGNRRGRGRGNPPVEASSKPL